MLENLYLFSGLGADERVFSKLDLTDYNVNFIRWEIPLKDESIAQYANRLSPQIKGENPILIGLSFGGMLAIEVAKQMRVRKIILLSSVKTKDELPFYFRWSRYTKLHKLMRGKKISKSNPVLNWMFGINNSSDAELLGDILKNTDQQLLNWAIDRIVGWENKFIPGNLQHIHGTSDHIFPIKFVECNHKIIDGGHFMTLNKFEEVSAALRKILQSN